MREELYAELARRVPPQEGRIMLNGLRFPTSRITNDASGQLFWADVDRLIDAGVLLDGLDLLARMAHEWYPANPVFTSVVADLDAAAHQSAAVRSGRLDPGGGARAGAGRPAAEAPAARLFSARPAQTQAETPPDAPPVPEPRQQPEQTGFPALVAICSDGYEGFLRAVRQDLDPGAELFFASVNPDTGMGQVAVSLTREVPEDQVAALQRRLVDGGLPPDLEILQQVYDHRPHLLETLLVNGPDQQPYVLEGVPSTTPVRDIAAAILGAYQSDSTRDRTGRLRRTVVDHLQADGSFQRLDPGDALFSAGVRNGDTLSVFPEAVAGSDLRIRAVAKARTQIQQYAAANDTFEIVMMDNAAFPTEYEVRFNAPGLQLPDNPQRAGDLSPVPQDEHNVLILLGPDFPLAAPAAIWLSPVFHPNILGPGHPEFPEGLVCLGALEGSYRPTFPLGQLCQMLVDVASYHNYDVRQRSEGGEGWYNARAAQWARTTEGRAMIEAIGGQHVKEPAGGARRPQTLKLRNLALRTEEADVAPDVP